MAVSGILFVSCLLSVGGGYLTHAQVQYQGYYNFQAAQSDCDYDSGTLRGVVYDFNPRYGGPVFPPLSYVFNIECGNFADDWNVVSAVFT